MPTYEFRCPEGHEFEKFYRTISGAESVAACPQCGEIAERIMSATGFAFKGSGFYLTDYGKNAHRGTPEAKGGQTPAKEGGSDASSGEGSGGDKAAAKSTESAATAPAESKKTESKQTESKPAEAKPAAPPKPSSGE